MSGVWWVARGALWFHSGIVMVRPRPAPGRPARRSGRMDGFRRSLGGRVDLGLDAPGRVAALARFGQPVVDHRGDRGHERRPDALPTMMRW